MSLTIKTIAAGIIIPAVLIAGIAGYGAPSTKAQALVPIPRYVPDAVKRCMKGGTMQEAACRTLVDVMREMEEAERAEVLKRLRQRPLQPAPRIVPRPRWEWRQT